MGAVARASARALCCASAVAAALLLAGCASAGRSPAIAVEPGTEPWEVPATALGKQYLYRVRYEGPDGGGSFRLTLRLERETRYQVQTVDPIGRGLWSLGVAGPEGLWLDHRAAAACRLEGDLDLVAGQLTPFPLAALPALLLGRLPTVPDERSTGLETAGTDAGQEAAGAGQPSTVAAGRPLALVDRQGRRWSVVVDRGAVLSWSMSEPGGPVPEVTWRRRGAESVLADRGRGIELAWSLSVVEDLPGALPPLEVPRSYARVPCEVLYAGSGDR